MKNASERSNDLCVGIDLGTTNSAIATINEKLNGNIVSSVIEIQRLTANQSNEERKKTLPSVVYYSSKKNFAPIVGDFAKKQYSLRPYLVAKSIKSQMGKATVEGLSNDVPDKTPPEIASRILKHILARASKTYGPITDAVITVPANFDSAMCKATIQAAELAGIKVKNNDGSQKAILLSEPNAVIYNLINEIRNGEISNNILDLSEKKIVLVFDIGGGTLDITMHEIKRREDNNEVIKIKEIATNRYTLLGGDDFDQKIAEAMYERYKKQCMNDKNILVTDKKKLISKIEEEKDNIYAILKAKAEQLKIDLGIQKNNYISEWDDDNDILDISTKIEAIGYHYNDIFTKKEIEDILISFMAPDLVFDDYKRIDEISDTKNIIYPILDVLNKAEKVLGKGNVVVDKVIMNGGMSEFYMIEDRLKQFFGFELCTVLDPDTAVAKGAAIYHYYLKKDARLQDDMKIIGKEQEIKNPIDIIELERSVSDSLYIGTKNGVKTEIIPTGVKLPYTSEVISGFKMEPGEKESSILIKCKNIDNSDRIIANAKLSLKHNYEDGAFLFFKIQMDTNKVISMIVWTSTDYLGNYKVEEQYLDIIIDTKESTVKNRILPPRGSVLQPNVEIQTIMKLYNNIEDKKNMKKAKESMEVLKLKKKINILSDNICSAGNKQDFADTILYEIENTTIDEIIWRLFYIARKIGNTWTDSQKKKLAVLCKDYIKLSEFEGLSINKIRKDTTIQAILTLSICGTNEQIQELNALHNLPMYLPYCLYTYAKTNNHLEFLAETLNQKNKDFKDNILSYLYVLRVTLKECEKDIISQNTKYDLINWLCDIIKNKEYNVLEDSILTLAFVCEQKHNMKQNVIDNVINTIKEVEEKNEKIKKSKIISLKIINGEILNEREEKFVSIKLNL